MVVKNPKRAIVIWGAALGLLASQVAQGHLTLLDGQMAQWVRAWQSPAFDGLMRALTFFGSSVWALAILAALASLAWRRGRWPKALTLGGAFLLGLLIEGALRLWVSQWRPDTVVVPPALDLIGRMHLAGFPSGHAFRSAFVFGWVSKELESINARWVGSAQILCGVMIALVGASRVYLNRHWATDVLGSWLVALLVLSIAKSWQTALKSGV